MSRRLGAIVAILGGGLALAIAAYVFVADFPRGLVVLACVLALWRRPGSGLLRRGRPASAGLRRRRPCCSAWRSGCCWPAATAGAGPWSWSPSSSASTGAREAFQPNRSLPRAAPPSHPVLFVNPRSGDGRAAGVRPRREARRAGHRGGRAEARRRPRGAGPRRRSRRERTAWRWRAATARRPWSPRSPPSTTFPTPASRPAPATTSPSTSASTETTSSARSTPSSTGASGWSTWARSTAASSSTTSRSASTRRPSARRATASRSCGRCWTPFPTPLGPRERRTSCAGSIPTADQRSTALVLVSNNAYLLGPTLGSGTRPRLDEAVLGIVDFRPPVGGEAEPSTPWRELTMPELDVDADGPVPTGIDGESIVLEPPLRFRSRPAALRVRIAPKHPGASPSANLPTNLSRGLAELVRIAASAGG